MLLEELAHFVHHLAPVRGAIGLHAAVKLFVQVERDSDELLHAERFLPPTDEPISGG